MRRDRANRHRASFLVQIGPQLGEILALVGETPDADVAEAAAFELRRMGDTAERLGLDAVAGEARRAIALAPATGWRRALQGIARVVRASPEADPFGPAFVVVPPKLLEGLEAAAQNTAERVLGFASAEQAGDSLEVPSVVVLPASDAAAIAHWSGAGAPVIAWGESDSWAVRAAAVEAGAQAYLLGPLDLEAALDQARWLAWQRAEPPVAAVLGEEDGLGAALAADGIRVIPPTELVETWSPDAAVVTGRDAARLLRALRAHPGWNRTAVLALSNEPVAGADQVLPPDAPLDLITRRLRSWLHRVRSVSMDHDPLTGLANRPASLRAIDDWLAWGRRTNTPLSVGLVHLDGFGDLRAGSSSLAAEAAVHRATAAALRRMVRRLDVVGRVTPSLYVVGLPKCRADEARSGVTRGIESLNGVLSTDPRLAGVSAVLGVADSATTADRLLARAWENLALTRQGG